MTKRGENEKLRHLGFKTKGISLDPIVVAWNSYCNPAKAYHQDKITLKVYICWKESIKWNFQNKTPKIGNQSYYINKQKSECVTKPYRERPASRKAKSPLLDIQSNGQNIEESNNQASNNSEWWHSDAIIPKIKKKKNYLQLCWNSYISIGNRMKPPSLVSRTLIFSFLFPLSSFLPFRCLFLRINFAQTLENGQFLFFFYFERQNKK